MLGGKNKQQSQPLGYTIIEVMIVLAVSGVMFIIAASFINGKQEQAAFAQGSNDAASKLQNLIEDIADGHYSDVPVQCAATGGGLTASATASGNQGESSACVFLGKMLRFYDPAGGTNRDTYDVYSIAAARGITSFPNPQISAIDGLVSQSVIPQSLRVKRMTVRPASGPSLNIYNIGFLQGLGQVDSATGSYLTGAQQPIQLVYANPGNSLGDFSGTNIKPAQAVTICLTDDTRYAQILIGAVGGGNNNQLNVIVQQWGQTSC